MGAGEQHCPSIYCRCRLLGGGGGEGGGGGGGGVNFYTGIGKYLISRCYLTKSMSSSANPNYGHATSHLGETQALR